MNYTYNNLIIKPVGEIRRYHFSPGWSSSSIPDYTGIEIARETSKINMYSGGVMQPEDIDKLLVMILEFKYKIKIEDLNKQICITNIDKKKKENTELINI